MSTVTCVAMQVRGSVPLFWTQDPYAQHRLKPDILLQRFDPLYEATRLHFEVNKLYNKDSTILRTCPARLLL